MNSELLLRSLCELINSTPREELVVAYRGFKYAHSPEERQLLDAGFDLYTAGVSLEPKSRNIVVALIHGIRTTGIWQERVRAALRTEKGVVVSPIGYGVLDLIRFIGPWRRGPIERVQSELRDLQRLHPNSDLVVVAHSFGTYIVSKILKEAPDIRVLRILLCGSIIPIDFRWDRLPHDFNQQNLVNDVGTKDYWPVLARVFSWGYGCSGAFGFKSVRVLDRFFNYQHSDFFSEEHIKSFWFPFILQGEVVGSPWDSDRPASPWWIGFLGGVPMVKIILLSVVIGLLAVIYYAMLRVEPFLQAVFN